MPARDVELLRDEGPNVGLRRPRGLRSVPDANRVAVARDGDRAVGALRGIVECTLVGPAGVLVEAAGPGVAGRNSQPRPPVPAFGDICGRRAE